MGGGGFGVSLVSRDFFFFEKRMKIAHSEPFLGRLRVNIFSKIVATFCHDFEFTLYIEGIFPLPWKGGGGGGCPYPFINGCKVYAF